MKPSTGFQFAAGWPLFSFPPLPTAQFFSFLPFPFLMATDAFSCCTPLHPIPTSLTPCFFFFFLPTAAGGTGELCGGLEQLVDCLQRANLKREKVSDSMEAKFIAPLQAQVRLPHSMTDN
jgi:hypothetical protein